MFYLSLTGSTSAGKSTLLNALLGEPILPVDYNATTSVLCEIVYGEKKEAVLHVHNGQELTIDLTTDEGQKNFVKAVAPKTMKCSRRWKEEDISYDNVQCTRVTISWPNEHLRVSAFRNSRRWFN